jgi:3-dehydroquinate dehydratase
VSHSDIFLLGNVLWYPLIEEAKIELKPSSFTPPSNSEEWFGRAASSLIERTLRLLGAPISKKWILSPYMNLSSHFEHLKRFEMRFFQELDGVYLMEKYFQTAHGELASSLPTLVTCFPGMLLSRQIHKVDDRSQAQERLLVKVVQQNEETVEILRRVEEVVIGIADGMKVGFNEIRQELSATNEEGLLEVKELWVKKMGDLEKAIATGGEQSTKLVESQMKKLEAMFTAKLFDLDVPCDGIKTELQAIQKQLIEANTARLNGEKSAEKRLETILTELKSLQTQLDRVEAMTTRIFQTMERGFADIRKELLENSNAAGLQELRELWLRKVSDLEKTLATSRNSDGASDAMAIAEMMEKQLKKMEVMIDAKLLDLDLLSVSSISPQLDDVKQQLQEVLRSVHQGDRNSQKKLEEMMTDLRELQTELVEVIRLQGENSKNLTEVSRDSPSFLFVCTVP